MTNTTIHKLAAQAHKGNLTLSDALSVIEDDALISVGAYTGYFAITSKASFLASVKTFDKKFKKEAVRAHDIAREHFSIDISNFNEINRNYLNGTPAKQISVANTYRNMADVIYRDAVTLKETTEWDINYVNLLDRKVNDIFFRAAEDGIAIQLEGPESGNIWLESENKKKEKTA